MDTTRYRRSKYDVMHLDKKSTDGTVKVHIGNTAGIGSVLAKYQGYPPVYCFDETTHRQFGGQLIDWNGGNRLSRLITRKRFLTELRNYDVWHYHYPYGRLKEALEKSKGTRKYLKHYHGDDIRDKHDDDFCLVSTPDLLQFTPNGVWFPTPIDLEELVGINTTTANSKIRIAHYPHYKEYESADNYSEALDSLENVDIVRITGTSHHEAIEAMGNCDIVVGKILPNIGWFGKLELEAMALGKPVTAYISDELYEKYRPPVYRVTVKSLADGLRDLAEDEKQRNKLGELGRAYVTEHHDARKVVQLLEGYYQKS
jgi:glycosyltransferase involved in cell wall biosynthesis